MKDWTDAERAHFAFDPLVEVGMSCRGTHHGSVRVLMERVDQLEGAIREAHKSHTVDFMSARTGLVIDPPRPIEECTEEVCEALRS